MNPLSEREIIVECQNGSQVAFKQLVEVYYQQAFSMAYYWTHNREAALDISQDSFLRVYKNIQRFDLNRPFKAWLFRIVKNLAINYLERVRNRRTVFSDIFEDQNMSDGFAGKTIPNFEGRELKEVVWNALKQLRDNDRDIILLKDFEDYSYEEISEALEIPMGTVMSRLFNARKRLARILKETAYA